MTSRLLVLSTAIVLFIGSLASQTPSDETEAKVGDWTDFVLSPEARAAGIDGKLQIGLTISADGKASNIRIFGGPMWPCGVKEPDEVEKVRKAVKDYLGKATFQPATKKGKPKSSEVQITFLLSDLFRNAANSRKIQEDLKNNIFPPLVEVQNIQRFALKATKQVSPVGNSISSRLTEMQILVSESGQVISAGGFRAAPIYVHEGRSLACASTFKPLMYGQTPLKMTGIIRYGLQ